MEHFIWAVLAAALLVLIFITINMRLQLNSLRNVLIQIRSENDQLIREEMARNREEMGKSNRDAREELGGNMRALQEMLGASIGQMGSLQKDQLDTFGHQITALTQTTEQRLDNIRSSLETKLQVAQEGTGRELKNMSDSIAIRMARMSELQQNQLADFSRQIGTLTESNEKKLEQMRETVENRVKALQNDNAQKLEQMRAVVDEKLHATLEQRLGESFKLVSERLELVHKGLGEMQVLASGVGDLKKVLSNVKTRGTWGEVQLGNILEDILAPEQYAANVAVKKGSERVEYAIKMPGPEQDGESLWLPIDAKFPMEDYYRLIDAYDQGDLADIEQAVKVLEQRIKTQARDISSKYIEPPATTDFAIMFLPTEGLYAEALRRPGLLENLRRDYRVNLAGPTTLAAIVSSLSLGFRTLAIQKRSSEVWAVLGAVKTEFGKFGTVLEKTQKKIQEAGNILDDAARRSRAMERKLRNVEALPESRAAVLLGEELADEIAAGIEME